MNSSYYLRWKGVTTGPLTPDQVREQFRTGKISRFHEVSPDQRDWRPLAELPELLPKPPPVVAAPTVVPTGKRTLTPLSGASRAELPNNTPDEPVPPPSRRAPAATAEAECPNGALPTGMATTFCTICGKPLTAAAVFCTHCGAAGPGSGPDLRTTFRPVVSGLAIASLVLGLFGCSLPAVICGHLARRRIRNADEALTGSGMALAGLIMGYVMLILMVVVAGMAGLLLPALGAAREKARRINCAGNLKQIGLACKMYANDYNGCFPPDFKFMLESKYLDAPMIYICPSGTAMPAATAGQLDDPRHCSYLYFGGGYTEDELGDNSVLAADRDNNHPKFWNVVLGNGSVAGYQSGDDFTTVAKRNGWRIPAPRAPK